MTNINTNLIERRVKEFRPIKITSKRQITIPKSIFDQLQLRDGDSLVVYALDDKIMLEPLRVKEAIYDQDVKTIITQAISEGYNGNELADEIYFRLKEYDNFFVQRVQKFEADIADKGMSDGSGDALGDDSFNGLDVFFNHKDGAPHQEG